MVSQRRLAALLASAAIVFAACSSSGASTAPSAASSEAAPSAATSPSEAAAPVTIDWWHIQNNDPGKADWQAMADAFTAEHPNVTIDITVMENEAFKAALQTNLQAGDVPDLFQSWGGGALRDQVAAGLVQDITEPTSGWIGNLGAAPVGLYQVEGKQYGVPFDAGIVGFWYNKDLFAQAGI
jgi:raffinose/stachyose/melibiose transport system substrate-binding protein